MKEKINLALDERFEIPISMQFDDIDNGIFKVYEYLPSYYMANSLYDVWFGENFDYLGYLLSCCIFAAIGLVIYVVNILKVKGLNK